MSESIHDTKPEPCARCGKPSDASYVLDIDIKAIAFCDRCKTMALLELARATGEPWSYPGASKKWKEMFKKS